MSGKALGQGNEPFVAGENIPQESRRRVRGARQLGELNVLDRIACFREGNKYLRADDGTIFRSFAFPVVNTSTSNVCCGDGARQSGTGNGSPPSSVH